MSSELLNLLSRGEREAAHLAADPGHISTDLNGHRGTQTVTEGTDAIVTLATESPEADSTGRFIDRFGPVTW